MFPKTKTKATQWICSTTCVNKTMEHLVLPLFILQAGISMKGSNEGSKCQKIILWKILKD